MIILGHIGLFFLAAITRGVVNTTHSANLIVVIIWLATAGLGVYFLGWGSLITFILGSFSAGFVQYSNTHADE